jgi:hypothetical protein
VLTLLVLVLAFLTASFPARNSDLWLHLAAGRLLARGDFSFGADPFAYTTGRQHWANHAWLCDLGLYELYTLAGGAALVVAKALLVTALAWLLLGVRRPGGAAWLPALGTSLALLALGPWLVLQPVCVSYFLLGLTFWLLWKPHRAAARQEGTAHGHLTLPSPPAEGGEGRVRWSAAHYALLPVFVCWVNLDEWFWLGPVLAALFWLGERLGGPRRTPGWLVPAGLAVCLLNPHTYHAFVPPHPLSPVPWSSGLYQDARFHSLFASPWRPASLDAVARLNAAALAYFLLAGLGLLSFVLHRQALRGWRLTVWLPFALLAAVQAWAVPFFAVISAPVTVLNGQDFLAGLKQGAAASGRWGATFFATRAGGMLTAVLLLALIFLTWPGWLTGYDRPGRHVAWEVQAEPSLRRAAEALHRWRRRGLVPASERVLALSPEGAQYAAWFCPGEKQFFDARFRLFPEAAGEFETVCRALLPGLVLAPRDEAGTEAEAAADWRQVLRDHRVGIVVFYDRDPKRLFAVLRRLAADRTQWTLLDVAGQALIAGWNEARPPGGFARLAFDADRLAFGPQDERARHQLAGFARQGPEHLPARPGFWARWARPPAGPSWESGAATMYLHYFDDTEASQARRRLHESLGVFAAGLVGLPLRPAAAPQVALPLCVSRSLLARPRHAPAVFLVRDQLGPYFNQVLERSPALPLLAVRAARRAVADSPHDANAWLRLGQAYLLLRSVTCERTAEGQLPPLAELRYVQTVTALEEAVRLDPDLQPARHELASLYGGRHFFDQALEHHRQNVRLIRQAGPHPGETAAEWDDRLELLDKDLARLEELVEERRKRYAAAAPALEGDRLVMARLALRLGLARQAADDILLPTPADLLTGDGLKLELELLLALGRAEDVRAIFGDEAAAAHKDGLPYSDLRPPRDPAGGLLYQIPYHWPSYDWLHAVQAAAVGDYTEAEAALRTIRSRLHIGRRLMRLQLRDFEPRIRFVLPGLWSGPPAFLPAFSARALTRLLRQRAFIRDGEAILRAQQADLDVLEGLLALERGDPEAARSAFTRAQRLCARPGGGAAVPFAGAPLAASYLSKLNGSSRQ